VHENQVGLRIHDTNQLLAYDDDGNDDVNLLRDNVDILKKNTETLIDVKS
jgi:hypothetical protein